MDRSLAALERASGLEDLQAVIIGLRDTYQIDHMVYHWVNIKGDQYGCGTYSPDWVTRYVDQEYLRIDPVILGCYQRFHQWIGSGSIGHQKRRGTFNAKQLNTGLEIKVFQFRSEDRTDNTRCSQRRTIVVMLNGRALPNKP